jgi:DNA-binding LytR/AlgR family response regulator
MAAVTALVADDEPLLRDRLVALLQRNWPELQIVATARNGREAVEMFDTHAPQIAFLDVHMPGMNGIEAAKCIGQRAALVFVTAHEQYAVQAFRQGAIDYIVKPLDEERLQETVRRLRQRLEGPIGPVAPSDSVLTAHILDQLSVHIRSHIAPVRYLQWIKASVGSTVRLIPVEQIRYIKSDTKYTLVVWEGGEALIRKTIRELADELDPSQFLQIHRSAIVNLHQIQQFSHGNNDGGEVQIKGSGECLPVSRSFVHLFRQM